MHSIRFSCYWRVCIQEIQTYVNTLEAPNKFKNVFPFRCFIDLINQIKLDKVHLF